jgi:hypothetical protein
MRRALLLVALACCAVAAPAGAESWHSEQPVGGTGVPEPLGEVGDIEFWAPNRGVLITAGVGGMPAGVYAYDGAGWHLYSTVCGGHQGRIAWTGPDEFWTISDQPLGQELPGSLGLRSNRSLCHFKGGRVVASYAEPTGQETSYMRMSAVACSGPDDCWFGGEELPGTLNTGAFHLHWDGVVPSALPSLIEAEPELEDPAEDVRDLAFFEGRFYESTSSAVHLIEPGAVAPFQPLPFGEPVPGLGSAPIQFTSDGERLWAVTTGASGLVVLQVDSDGVDPTPLIGGGSISQVLGVAAEPGADRVWVSFRQAGGEGGEPVAARVTAFHADGSVDSPTLLPADGEGIGRKGSAGPIACPGKDQCWMVTEKGWLFHLGGSLPQDTDPAMRGVINLRPPDNSTPPLPPIELPIDDSGSESGVPPGPEKGLRERSPRRPKARKLVSDVHQTVIHGTVLELSFRLHTRARVRLVAKRDGRVVAQTPRRTMGKGDHRLLLRLDPKRWPTNLDFQVHAAPGRVGR